MVEILDYPEGYGWWSEKIGDDRVYMEVWKTGDVWKWSVTWASTGDGPWGTAPSREEAVRKACEAYEREVEEMGDEYE